MPGLGWYKSGISVLCKQTRERIRYFCWTFPGYERAHRKHQRYNLVLQDTTEFSFKKSDPSAVGFTRNSRVKRWDHRRPVIVPVCGVLPHSSLAITTDGLSLGLTAAKVWMRKKFKDSRAIARKINPTRVPIEEKEGYRWIQNLREAANLFDDSSRCVHVGDRESDIFELFCETEKNRLSFSFVSRQIDWRRMAFRKSLLK